MPPQPGSDSGVVGLDAAFGKYIGSYAGGVPSELRTPGERGADITPSEASERYTGYMHMLGN